jgi:RNA polymerase sigma factor (sigma-70 family)
MATAPQLQIGKAFDPRMTAGERQAAFESTVLVHLDAAYMLARYLTRNAGPAEDIVQEALIRAYRHVGSQRGENVRAWLLAIVRNCFLSWSARNGECKETVSESDLETSSSEEVHESETPESILIRHEENSALRKAVEELPHLFREVLVLRDIEDMSYREIAEVTGVPIGTVMSRLARARKMFAAAWLEAGTAKESQR